jgi:hypothetical protein
MSSDPRSVPEIRDAIRLFEQYEKSQLDYAASRHFVEAVELLNDYLEAETDSPHKDFIRRLKMSHTRSVLRSLAKVNRADGFAWAGHVAILINVNAEAEALTSAFPDLKEDYDEFFRVWGPELLEALQKLEKKARS